MSGHKIDGTDSDPHEKDAYDEFEERMRRIGDLVVAIWRQLTVDQRVGHGIALIGILVLIVYTTYTIRIYTANNRSANAAKDSSDLLRQQLEEANKAVILYDKPFNLGAAGEASFNLHNVGRYTATRASAVVTVTLHELPNGKIVKSFKETKALPDIPGVRSWVQDPSRDPNSTYWWSTPYGFTRISNLESGTGNWLLA